MGGSQRRQLNQDSFKDCELRFICIRMEANVKVMVPSGTSGRIVWYISYTGTDTDSHIIHRI